jgi:undecaprenyl-phosphate alpha-N-acetylglucosaminyl 1-phosphatetransferase
VIENFSGVMIFFVCLIAIRILTPIATAIGLVDMPSLRKRHESNVPLVGGIAIYFSISFALLLVNIVSELTVMVLSSGTILLLGLADDFKGVSVKNRLIIQIGACCVVIALTDVKITTIGFDIVGLTNLPIYFASLITVFAVVGLTNAFNMIDGIDGLSSGQILIGVGLLAISSWMSYGVILEFEWLSILFSAVAAFWLINTSVISARKVFLGDAGSSVLGFMFAWTLIYLTQASDLRVHPVVALWCVTHPVFDTLVTIFLRVRLRNSPFASDRRHLHYALTDRGLSSTQVLRGILVGFALLSAIGIFITIEVSPALGLLCYCGFFCIHGLIIIKTMGEEKQV